MKWKLLVPLGLLTLGLVFALGRAFGKDPHEVPFMLLNKPAPAFSLKQLNTNETISSEQLKGQPLVLNFWASWCEPCEEEQPGLDRAAARLKGRANMLGIIFEDTETNARKAAPFAYRQLVDPRSQVAVDYGISGVPETYLIDAKGVIAHKWNRPVGEDELVAAVEQLLPREVPK